MEVVSIEVTQAVRPVAINGLQVAEDDYIGLLDRDLVAVGETPKDALVSVLEMVELSGDSIVTLYLGADTPWEDGEGLQQELESKDTGSTGGPGLWRPAALPLSGIGGVGIGDYGCKDSYR